MTDAPVFDPQAIEKLADEKATAKMEELKHNLVSSLTGVQPEKAPESWSALRNDIKSEILPEAVSQAEKNILSKLEAERQAEVDRVTREKEQSQARTQAEQDAEWQNQSAQWRDAVKAGILPGIQTPGLAEKLDAWQKGKGDAPTPEELADPGIVAYAETRALHDKLKKEGKAESFYYTAQNYYNKQPAGANAPVLGNAVATSQKNGYTYSEVRRENASSSKFADVRARAK